MAQHFGTAGSVERSFSEARRVASLAGAAEVPIIMGSPAALVGLEGAGGRLVSTGQAGSGADFIVREAMREDARPLYLLCMGPLTDVALALRLEPAIASRCTAVWVGGGRYPAGGHEANLGRDLQAAREVFAADIPLWQIPSQAYKLLAVPVSQLQIRVEPCGELGRYLYRQLVEFRDANMARKTWINPESWVLGDQAALGVLLAEQKGCFTVRPAPGFADDCAYTDAPDPTRTIRVYRGLNDRLVLEDLFAKLALHAG